MADDQVKNELDAGELTGERALDEAFGDAGDSGDMAPLEQWLNDHPGMREVYNQLMDPAQRQRMLEESQRLGQAMPEEWQRLLSKIEPAPVLQSVRRTNRKIIYYFSGAAAAIAIAAGTLILVKHSTKVSQPQVVAATRDIAPGGNKAILTLSNGQTITLDNASNGLLAQQGKVNVLKSAQGQLDYQAGKYPSSEIVYNTMTTPRGGTFKLTLADGTKVWLNAASSLRYPVSFAGSKLREVSLTGEGYFEIAPNKSVPFTVTTGGAVVKVLGTAFDVMAYDDEKELQTTLLDGAVAVNENDQTRILKPGQQARITPEGAMSVAKVDGEDYIAWKNGLIQLHSADIPTIMRQIGRWYNVDIKYQGSNFPSMSIEGTVPRTLNLSQVMKALELYNIHCKLEDKTLTVISN